MSWRSRDPMLARLERNLVVFGVTAAGLALLVRGGNPDVALGVVGGWLIVALSYGLMRAAVSRWLSGSPGGAPSADVDSPAGATALRRGRVAVAFVARYALLGLIAYVMISRLRLHPIGLLLGASSVLVSAAIEAFRTLSQPGTR